MALDLSAPARTPLGARARRRHDRIRSATEALHQALTEAELTATAPGHTSAPPDATVTGSGPCDDGRGRGAAHPEAAPRVVLPSLLERRRRIDQALFAVVMEAHLHGVSTRRGDDPVEALGADTGISKSEVSRIHSDLHEEVAAFRDSAIAHDPGMETECERRRADA